MVGTVANSGSRPHNPGRANSLGESPAFDDGPVLIGLISYPLYLWHWPMLCFARILMPVLSVKLTLVLLLSSGILAWLTYRYAELRIRSGEYWIGRNADVAVLSAGLCVACLMGAGIVFLKGIPSRLAPGVQTVAADISGSFDVPHIFQGRNSWAQSTSAGRLKQGDQPW